MAADEDGCLWIAFYRGWAIARFRPDGELDRLIDVPAHKPLSLCFGGPDRSQLYVVTGTSDDQPGHTGSVLEAPVDVRGLEIGSARI
jgi:sugar lactone lactonase YvrE